MTLFGSRRFLVTLICCICELIRQNIQWSLNFWLLSTLPSTIFIPLFSDLGLESSGRTWQNFRFWQVFRAVVEIFSWCWWESGKLFGIFCFTHKRREREVCHHLESPGWDSYTWLKPRKLFCIFLFGSWTTTAFTASHFADVFFACCQECQKQLTPDITMLIDLIH